MPLALVIAGVLLLVSAVRDKQSDLVTLVKGDLLGTGSNDGTFIQWALALVMVGAIGYIPRLKPVSVALLALVLVGIFLRKGKGFFSQLSAAAGLQQTNG
jgi:hypothetical protein